MDKIIFYSKSSPDPQTSFLTVKIGFCENSEGSPLRVRRLGFGFCQSKQGFGVDLWLVQR
jgi:hypothetical protein